MTANTEEAMKYATLERKLAETHNSWQFANSDEARSRLTWSSSVNERHGTEMWEKVDAAIKELRLTQSIAGVEGGQMLCDDWDDPLQADNELLLAADDARVLELRNRLVEVLGRPVEHYGVDE